MSESKPVRFWRRMVGLFIDEINLLRLQEQQALLTAMQEKAFPISGRSERSSGALTKSKPYLVFHPRRRGNLDAVQHMHQHCEVEFVDMVTKFTSIRPCVIPLRTVAVDSIIAQEVRNEQNKRTGNPIPHFDVLRLKSSFEGTASSRSPGQVPCAYVSWEDWSNRR